MIPTIKKNGYKWNKESILKSRIKEKEIIKRKYEYAIEERVRRNEMAKIRYKLKKRIAPHIRIELKLKLEQLKIKK